MFGNIIMILQISTEVNSNSVFNDCTELYLMITYQLLNAEHSIRKKNFK